MSYQVTMTDVEARPPLWRELSETGPRTHICACSAFFEP